MGKVFCIVLILLALSLCFSDVSGKTWYIKPDGTGDAITIQAGIDSCVAGDTVLVAPGIYTGDGNWDIDFDGKSIVVIAEHMLNPSISDSTFIDCGGNHRGFYFPPGESYYPILEGFVIENGYTSDLYSKGGGIYCDSTSSPTIKNNIIRDCIAWYGSGIYCYYSSPIIDSNDIYNNDGLGYTGGGGGIYCYESSAIIVNNSIHHNCSSCGGPEGSPGGGIYCEACSSITIIKNKINNNAAYDYGGGIFIYNSTGRVDSNYIKDNFVPTDFSSGGGIMAWSCTLSISGNEIIENDVQYGAGAGVYCWNATVNIADNIISSNGLYGTWYGAGGIEMFSSDGTIANNVIATNKSSGIGCVSCSPLIENNIILSNNTSYIGGGGIYCETASPAITNNTIVNNLANDGGGIYCDSGSSPMISNNIVAFNKRRYAFGGGGIYTIQPSVPISCCNVYGNEGGNYIGPNDTTGINGNISVDPLFCYPDEYDYHLQYNSPCVPGNHPDEYSCGLIGALGVGCGADEPYIIRIEDIGNDQGRQVNISWYASRLDTAGSAEPIQTYEVYRRIDDLPIPPVDFVEDGLTTTDSERILSLTYPPGDWHYLFDIPAHGEKTYHVVAPTLEDSCVYNTTDYYSVFFIRATTAVLTNYYESPIDSGYSVDNLAPGVPSGFMVAYLTGSNELVWDESEALDFQCFRIYRGESADFEPLLGNLVHMTGGTSWMDTAEDCWRYAYKITAVDHAGNESEATYQEPITNADMPTVPDAYVLYQNVPNPFNPTTTIRFDLPRAVHVKLRVYNVKGELVATIVDRFMDEGRKEVSWTAKDKRGRSVSSGIYFYRFVAGDFVQTRKMVLLQ